MSNISVSFSLQTLDGANANIVGISRSTSLLLSNYTATVSEQLIIAQNSVDTAYTLGSIASKVFVFENIGAVDLKLRLNSNVATQVTILAGGFAVLTTSTAISSIYVSNADPSTQGTFRVFIGG